MHAQHYAEQQIRIDVDSVSMVLTAEMMPSLRTNAGHDKAGPDADRGGDAVLAGVQLGGEAEREAGAAVQAVPGAALAAVALRLHPQGAQVRPRQRRQRQEAQDER